MAKYRVERDGQAFIIDIKEGEDPQAAANRALGTPQPSLSAAAAPADPSDILPEIPSFDDDVSGSIAEEQERRRLIRVAEGRELTPAGKLKRKAGLAARIIPSAAAKLPASLADLAASAVNVPIAGLDVLGQMLGDEPLDVRLPTGAVPNVQALLNEIFPEPESFGERIIEGIGDIAGPGVVGGALAAPKVISRIGEGVQALSKSGIPFTTARAESAIPALSDIPAVEGGRSVPSLIESIGSSFAKSPKTFAALESTGAAGAEIAAELVDDADASPGVRAAATLAGGLTGVLAPQTAVNLGRRGVASVTNFIDAAVTGERRAAKALQEAVADPEVAARAAREAPEVLPARATEEPRLQALESKVLLDDPALELKTANELAELEARSLDELGEVFGPTSSKTEFEQTVIQRGAAPGFRIKPGQPDEMLDQAARSFDQAYDDVGGFEIRTQDFSQKNVVPLKDMLAAATTDTRVIAGGKTRKGIANFLDALLTDVSRRGTTVGPAADAPISRILSEDLIEMRQIIRQEVRSRAGPTVSAKAKAEGKLLQNAADEITTTLESQLPDAAATALRATDTRYKEFVTIQGAVLKSGEKGLTPEALTRSIKATATSQGAFARGQRGPLGVIAETGTDIRATLGKGNKKGDVQRAQRITRNMTPEQRQVAKADLADGLSENSSLRGRTDGKKLLEQIENNREVLKASGYTDADFTRIETIGKQLKLAQARSPRAVGKLVNDGTGVILNLLARIVGVKSGTRVLEFFGGGGAGGSFVLASFGSKQMQSTLSGLTIDNADRLTRAALRGDKIVVEGIAQEQSIFDSLMLKNTDSLKKQALSARTINSFLLGPVVTKTEEE